MKFVVIFFLAALAMVQAAEHHHRRHYPKHRHHASHHRAPAEPATPAVKVDDKESKEANELKAMMEGVKATTDKEAGLAPTASEKSAPKEQQKSLETGSAAVLDNQDDHAVDQKILGEAAKMEKMMFAHDGMKEKSKKKATGLVKLDQKTEESRAAHYFATHGMGKVGKMLGETLSKSEAAAAAKMIKHAEKVEKQGSTTNALDDVSMDMDEEADAVTKARWAKVDALRRKAAFRGA